MALSPASETLLLPTARAKRRCRIQPRVQASVGERRTSTFVITMRLQRTLPRFCDCQASRARATMVPLQAYAVVWMGLMGLRHHRRCFLSPLRSLRPPFLNSPRHLPQTVLPRALEIRIIQTPLDRTPPRPTKRLLPRLLPTVAPRAQVQVHHQAPAAAPW